MSPPELSSTFPVANGSTRPALWRRPSTLAAALAALLVLSAPWLWTTLAALGHVHDEEGAPAVEVVIVLGTEVMADGEPSARLAGRLQTAAALVQSGRARVILVSGDGGGDSGDEPAAMAAYLTRLGIEPGRIVSDAYGLDTYDSCIRARDVYGVSRALVATQSYHLSRAVTLCRRLGVDADGVAARCEGCGLLLVKAARDYLASIKAAWDAARNRPPAVVSPASPAIRDALAG
jgi:vancomycin permeability regulator SanA